MRLKILLLMGSLWVPSVAAQTLVLTGSGAGNVVTTTTGQSGQYLLSSSGNTVWVCNNGGCATNSQPESEADKIKRELRESKTIAEYWQNEAQLYGEKANMNDAAMKIIQAYIESNGYGWAGFNFLLHCAGLGILGMVGTVIYWRVKNPTKK